MSHEADPIFALITRRDELIAKIEATAGDIDVDEEERLLDIEYAVLTTPPTTLAGVIAVLAFVRREHEEMGFGVYLGELCFSLETALAQIGNLPEPTPLED